MNEPKTITRSEYLQAFALYTMAARLQSEVDKYEVEMNKILGLEAPEFTGSRMSDGIYSRPAELFDLLLTYVKITVETEPAPPSRASQGAEG